MIMSQIRGLGRISPPRGEKSTAPERFTEAEQIGDLARQRRSQAAAARRRALRSPDLAALDRIWAAAGKTRMAGERGQRACGRGRLRVILGQLPSAVSERHVVNL